MSTTQINTCRHTSVHADTRHTVHTCQLQVKEIKINRKSMQDYLTKKPKLLVDFVHLTPAPPAMHKHIFQCVIHIWTLQRLRSTSSAPTFDQICPWRMQKVLWVTLYLSHWLENTKRSTEQTWCYVGLYRAVCFWEWLSLPRTWHHAHGGEQAEQSRRDKPRVNPMTSASVW